MLFCKQHTARPFGPLFAVNTYVASLGHLLASYARKLLTWQLTADPQSFAVFLEFGITEEFDSVLTMRFTVGPSRKA